MFGNTECLGGHTSVENNIIHVLLKMFLKTGEQFITESSKANHLTFQCSWSGLWIIQVCTWEHLAYGFVLSACRTDQQDPGRQELYVFEQELCNRGTLSGRRFWYWPFSNSITSTTPWVQRIHHNKHTVSWWCQGHERL